jgi:hypothetical protein
MRRELQSLVDAVTPSPDAADLAAEILAHQVIELSGCSPTPSVTRLGWRSTTTGCKESSSRVGQVRDRMKVSTAKTTLAATSLRCRLGRQSVDRLDDLGRISLLGAGRLDGS